MKKKIVVQMMGVVLAAGLMAGCGGTSEDKNVSTAKTENTADETKDSEENVAANEESTDGDIGSVISAAGWNITVEDVEINSS